MGFFSTILAALKWKASEQVIPPLTGVVYRIQADTTRTHRAFVDAETTHRLRSDVRVTHRVVVEATNG